MRNNNKTHNSTRTVFITAEFIKYSGPSPANSILPRRLLAIRHYIIGFLPTVRKKNVCELLSSVRYNYFLTKIISIFKRSYAHIIYIRKTISLNFIYLSLLFILFHSFIHSFFLSFFLRDPLVYVPRSALDQ